MNTVAINTAGEGSAPPVNPVAGKGFRVVCVVLGVMLLATATLKLLDASPGWLGRVGTGIPPRWFMMAIEAEALLGIWLMIGAAPQFLWVVNLLFFSVLLSISLYLGINGQPTCGCFGESLPASPWLAVGMDLAALAALIFCARKAPGAVSCSREPCGCPSPWWPGQVSFSL